MDQSAQITKVINKVAKKQLADNLFFLEFQVNSVLEAMDLPVVKLNFVAFDLKWEAKGI